MSALIVFKASCNKAFPIDEQNIKKTESANHWIQFKRDNKL